ncbi:hypothetical protein D6C83_06059, partial [Aureobasidium pullulans]
NFGLRKIPTASQWKKRRARAKLSYNKTITLTGKLANLHEDSGGTRNSGWVPQTEMSKAAPGLFNKNNTLKAETCVHDLFNLKHKNRKGFRAHNPLSWIVHRQLCHSMAGCEVGAEGNLNALLAENNRDNHAAYQQLHDDYANFVKSKHKSAGQKRSKSTVRASNPATESPHPDTELIKTAAGRSEKCKLTVNDEEVARQRQAPIARLNEAFAKMPDLKLLMANQKTKHWTSLRVLLASQLLLRTRSCKTRLLVSDESLTGSKRWWSITKAKLSILPRRLAAPIVRDVRIRALEDASSGPVSLDGLSGHNEKHGEDSPTTSNGHMLTYDNLNASQSLTGDLGGVKPWLTATSNDTVQDQGSLAGNPEPTMPIQNATFEPESFRKTFAYLGWHERSRAYNSSVDNLMIGIALTRPSGP